MGSRLGTHAIWTLTLSAAISLLALSPIVLPSGTPLQRLPGPLAGIERVGRVVAAALAPPAQKHEPATSETTAPAPPQASPASTAETSAGVLAERTSGTPAKPRAHRGGTGETPPPGASRARPATPRALTKAEAKALRWAEKAEARAVRQEEKAAAKEERREDKAEAKAKAEAEKEHGNGRVGSSSAHGKKSGKARDKKGGGHS